MSTASTDTKFVLDLARLEEEAAQGEDALVAWINEHVPESERIALYLELVYEAVVERTRERVPTLRALASGIRDKEHEQKEVVLLMSAKLAERFFRS